MGRDQAPKILFLEGTAVKLVERGPERVSSSTETRTTVPKVRHLPVSTHKLHTHSVGTRGHSDVEVRRRRSRHIVIATPNQISCGHSTDKRRIVYSERGQTRPRTAAHDARGRERAPGLGNGAKIPARYPKNNVRFPRLPGNNNKAISLIRTANRFASSTHFASFHLFFVLFLFSPPTVFTRAFVPLHAKARTWMPVSTGVACRIYTRMSDASREKGSGPPNICLGPRGARAERGTRL